MWRKFVWSAASSYTNSLAVTDWKGEEAPTVDEVAGQLWQYEESLSSSLISHVEKLVQRLEENMPSSPPVHDSISAVRSQNSSAQEKANRGYTPQGTLWFYSRFQVEDMKKWDGKPISTLEAGVCELQGKKIHKMGILQEKCCSRFQRAVLQTEQKV